MEKQKTIKAWAIINKETGNIFKYFDTSSTLRYNIFKTKSDAEERVHSIWFRKVVKVEIKIIE